MNPLADIAESEILPAARPAPRLRGVLLPLALFALFAIAPMLIYILMAAVLFFRPTGLFPVKR